MRKFATCIEVDGSSKLHCAWYSLWDLITSLPPNRATQKELILKLKVKTVNKMLAAQEKMKHVGWKFSFFI
jgi:hypothetical protein